MVVGGVLGLRIFCPGGRRMGQYPGKHPHPEAIDGAPARGFLIEGIGKPAAFVGVDFVVWDLMFRPMAPREDHIIVSEHEAKISTCRKARFVRLNGGSGYSMASKISGCGVVDEGAGDDQWRGG